MLTGVLTVTSVDPVSGEEHACGELVVASVRGSLPFRAVRGDSLTTRAPALAARIATRLLELDAEHGRPVCARFDIAGDVESLASAAPASISPAALVRVLVERVRDTRLSIADALARITPAELDANGLFLLAATKATPIARGLAASPGAAAGRLAFPDDVTSATDGEPRVLVIDDAAPEDAMAIRAAVAILATSGGLTADAAIAARALRKPCVVSATIRVGDPGGSARGDWVTVDGSKGDVYSGALPTTWTPTSPYATELIGWLSRALNEPPSASLLRAQKSASQAGRG